MLASKFFVVPSRSVVFEIRPEGKGVMLYSYSEDSLSQKNGYRCVRLDTEADALAGIGENYEIQPRA